VFAVINGYFVMMLRMSQYQNAYLKECLDTLSSILVQAAKLGNYCHLAFKYAFLRVNTHSVELAGADSAHVNNL